MKENEKSDLLNLVYTLIIILMFGALYGVFIQEINEVK